MSSSGESSSASHFATDHLREDLKGRSVRAGAVTLSAQAIQFVLQLGSTAVLARLLTPADFGLIAMVATVTGFAALFKDLGLSQATVQRDHITHGQVSTLFWINVGVSAIVGLIVALAAPSVAWLYGDPRLLRVTVVLGGTFLFGGLAAQHTALLQRQMRFGALATVEIASLSAGIAAAIVMARAGAEYWALVGMYGVQSVVTTGGSWLASGWRPGPPRRGTDVRPMLRFGGNLTGFSVLNYFTRNFDNVLIGIVLGAGPLGIYSKAYGLLMMPIRQMNGPISSVVIPALSAIQRDDALFRRYFSTVLLLMTSVSMPICVFSIVEARSLVLVVLGQQWEAAAEIFLALGLGAFMGTFNVAPGWLYIARGRTRALFYYGLIAAPLTMCAMVMGLYWGAKGVAWGFSLAFSISYITIIPLSCRNTPVSPTDVLTSMSRPAIASVAAGCLVLCYKLRWSAGEPVSQLLVSAVIFLSAYVSMWLMSPGGRRDVRLVARLISQRGIK